MNVESSLIPDENTIVAQICSIVIEARKRVYSVVNTEMVLAYWNIGKIIVEAQGGNSRASYGEELLLTISQRLTAEFGKGFDPSNLRNMRSFFLAYPNCDTLCHNLSWSHYRKLMRVTNPKAREYYTQEASNGQWSVRQLERQIATQYYERLLSTQRSQSEIRQLIVNNLPAKPETFNPLCLVHDPFVLEFIGAKEDPIIKESQLEQAIIAHIEEFLLELGRGFAFVGRQKRIVIDGDAFYPDLVFYNVITKNYILIDLKMGKADYGDVGQMQLYVNYYNTDVKLPEDNPTIGIILCAEKNDAVIRYTLGNRNDINVFSSKYKLVLPTEEELKKEIEKTRETFRLIK